ncbi:MAG: DEAD/DEAH box helicase family protein [Clostridia bacterium]|nr:DEAD/DEAH box helicase family protein [Clostridia bacterium]
MTLEQMDSKLVKAQEAEMHLDRALLCRALLEDVVDFIYSKVGAKKPPKASLLELIDSPVVTGYINDADTINSLHYVRILGMNAKHGRSVRKKEAKLAYDNIAYLIGLIASKENGTESAYRKPPYMSEAATRRLYIDLYLKEAGWDVLDVENLAQPAKAGIEIEVQGMPNAHGVGYCDYVLYGKDGKPLAIIEVKKTSVDPEKGRHQVDLYGECMKKVYGYKPVLYYTNGYSTKIIDGIYPDRPVMAFHTMENLELMLQRRTRGDITDLTINDEITNRPYQKIAITNICEWLNAKHRRGLLVMATGTGKTRVAISLVDVLTRNNWVKNVLFLADRTSLVNQAKRNFAKLMPNMSVCELSAPGEKDYNARLMFCTYQTMINYIDAEDKRFSAGRFDLIIIDEAHRSIFNRYGTIFKYFDSFLVGLTATPKNEVDANTYNIFGCEAGIPNFDYSLEEAIKDKYLVGYHAISRSSELMENGIKYSALTDKQKSQLEEYVEEDPPTPDFSISGDVLFKYLYNKDTCRKVIEELMKWGLRVDNGETMGKSIIFAYNHKHAQMIVDCFHEMYPDYPANACQLVDYFVNYGEDLVVKFDEDPEFRIAVSVDMLDTGVDIPAVLNLVFFKKVRSKIKFVQMIGRGTRLCENIYGPGKNKSNFLIFDYCGNFEYFDQHPDGKEGKEMITLSRRLFQVRLDMLYELQRIEYQEDAWYHAYYDHIKTELHNTVIKIKSHDSRIQVREGMQYVDKYYNLDTWTSLSPVMVKEVFIHLAPLIDSGLNGEYLAVAFDVRMYYIEKALLKNNTITSISDHVKNIRLIAQYLLTEKASVPQVLAKAADLRTIMGEDFWTDPTVMDLERMRSSLRDLMQFLKGHEKGKFDIDIPDDIDDSDFTPDDTAIDIRTYREKVIDYLMEHSDNEVVRKIHNLEPINNADLQELEKVLWHDLGTQKDYEETTDIDNLAAFVRSLIGLSQEAVNEKFGEYLSGNLLNSQQQEFVRIIINYVRENGDVELADMVNTEPFNNYDLNEIFGVNLPAMIAVVRALHDVVQAA